MIDLTVNGEEVSVEDVAGLTVVRMPDRNSFMTLGPGVDPAGFTGDYGRSLALCAAALDICDWIEADTSFIPH